MALARPDLLAPYLELDQGGKIQAECTSDALASICTTNSFFLHCV